MIEDGIEKIIQGFTSVNELERVIELPQLKTPTETKTSPDTTEDVEGKDNDEDDDFLTHVV